MDTSQLFLDDCLTVLDGMADGSVNLIFCDPPYGHNNNDGKDLASVFERAMPKKRHKFWKEERNGQHGKPRPIKNDGEESDLLYRRVLRRAKRILVSDGVACFCCSGGGPDPQFARWTLWMQKYLNFKQMVVWDKGKMGMGWHYRRSYEVVLVGQNNKSKCAWYDDSGRIENIIRPGDYGIRKIIPSADQHPTEKPSTLAAHFIRLHTKPGDVVCDPFMGRGSTGEAAVKLGRRFVGVELGPEHFVEAEKRVRKAESDAKNGFIAPNKIVQKGFFELSE